MIEFEDDFGHPMFPVTHGRLDSPSLRFAWNHKAGAFRDCEVRAIPGARYLPRPREVT